MEIGIFFQYESEEIYNGLGIELIPSIWAAVGLGWWNDKILCTGDGLKITCGSSCSLGKSLFRVVGVKYHIEILVNNIVGNLIFAYGVGGISLINGLNVIDYVGKGSGWIGSSNPATVEIINISWRMYI